MDGSKGKIVVGVDGSVNSRNALRWAMDEAMLRDAKLCAVSVWHYPYIGDGWAPIAIDPEALRSAAETVLDDALAECLPRDASPPAVERLVVQGSASAALIEAAEDADLLVVGSRGLGGFRGLLLGSVSTQCVHHAPCPVAVIPSDEEE